MWQKKNKWIENSIQYIKKKLNLLKKILKYKQIKKLTQKAAHN